MSRNARSVAQAHVAIAGGGASGLLLAHALVAEGARVTIVEPRARLGAGVAYATTCPAHLLNAPAGKMSAFAGEPHHFTAWLAARGRLGAANDFVPRTLYGAYLDDIAQATAALGGDRLRHVRAVATGVTLTGGVRVACDDGSSLDADACVVAVGNPKPAPWPDVPAAVRSSGRFFDSAWIDGAVDAAPDEAVVLLGTGLTAVDAVLGLRHAGHRGPIAMVSRRGLLPHEHRLFDAPPALSRDATTIGEVIAAARDARRDPQSDWRLTVDALRAETNARWEALDLETQRRFVRHLLPYWNAHRHRMAPEAATAIAQLVAAGALRMIAGRTGALEIAGDRLRVPVRLRGSETTEVLEAHRAINCSGPKHDVAERENPLLRSLLAAGSLVRHPLRIGALVAPDGALIDAEGRPSTHLYALGPVRYGTLIETTAIPEIREQVRDLAAVLLERDRPAHQAGRQARM